MFSLCRPGLIVDEVGKGVGFLGGTTGSCTRTQAQGPTSRDTVLRNYTMVILVKVNKTD